MQNLLRFFRRAALPAGVFLTVILAHYIWTGYSLTRACAEESRAIGEVCCEPSWWKGYMETQSYWLGYSYGLSLAFAAGALRRYQEQRMCNARTLALGGVTWTGFLSVAACFLVGCCGSPMLGVYLSLFGASFLPLAKSLVAGITTLVVGASWWWMRRERKTQLVCNQPQCTLPEAPLD